MKKHLLNILLILIASATAFAQDQEAQSPTDSLGKELTRLSDELAVLKRLKVTGWIQSQYQHGDDNNVFQVAGGNPSNINANGSLTSANTSDRFFIRRGRVKFTYENEFSTYVLQIDATERAVALRDIYVKFMDPLTQTFSLTMGMQNRPFGYEIQQSSQVRETPERSRFTQILLTNERDIGAMLTIQLPKSSPFHFLKLDGGFFNGTGIFYEYDKKKDFIGRLSGTNNSKDERFSFGYGVSYYDGGVRQATRNIYNGIVTDSVGVKRFAGTHNVADSAKYAHRQYWGADMQITYDAPWGIIALRGEYMAGTQPSLSGSSLTATASPGFSANAIDLKGDIYNRSFNAAYFYLVQNIGKSKWQAVYKFDMYDPNIKVKGNDIGAGLTAADIKFTTFAFGINFRWNAHVKIMTYYDLVKNETSANLKGFEKDRKDNVLTLRVQYRF